MKRIRFMVWERRASLLVAFVAVSLAFAGAVAQGAPIPVLASGTAQLWTSKSGSIFPATMGMGSGDRVSGDITVKNIGTEPGTLRVTDNGLTNTLGSGGGDLSGALRLTITDSDAGAVLYDGSLADLSDRDLGVLAPAQARSLHLSVLFPAGGDGALQGGSVTVGFVWTLVAASVQGGQL